MPVFRLNQEIAFPPPERARSDGLLAVGGDLRPDRVLAAYRAGIFPWFCEGEPPLWWSPDPRFVLFTDELHVSDSLRRVMRRGEFSVTFDRNFRAVIEECANAPRKDSEGTWITRDMIAAYTALYEAGHAHSVEVWKEGALVGGLYGVAVGALFCGESMFARARDASKVGFVRLMEQLSAQRAPLVDCQVPTEHLARFGARPIPRTHFLEALRELAQRQPLRFS